MTATLTYTLGKFVWRELFTRDKAAAKAFYGGLFGWTFEDKPMGPDWSYTLVNAGGVQIAGIMDLADLPGGGEQVPPHWASYVSVADVDAAKDRAVARGAKLLSDCMDIPGVGRFAVIQDQQGAVLQLFRSANGDPEDRLPKDHEFCWETLSTSAPEAALPFYQDVVGWGTEPMGPETTLFTRKKADGSTESLASVGRSQEGQPSFWCPFVGVASIDATLAKVPGLGGQVIFGRQPIPEVGAFAILQDPTGAMLFLFERA